MENRYTQRGSVHLCPGLYRNTTTTLAHFLIGFIASSPSLRLVEGFISVSVSPYRFSFINISPLTTFYSIFFLQTQTHMVEKLGKQSKTEPPMRTPERSPCAPPLNAQLQTIDFDAKEATNLVFCVFFFLSSYSFSLRPQTPNAPAGVISLPSEREECTPGRNAHEVHVSSFSFFFICLPIPPP